MLELSYELYGGILMLILIIVELYILDLDQARKLTLSLRRHLNNAPSCYTESHKI